MPRRCAGRDSGPTLFLDPILYATAEACRRGLGLDQIIERAQLETAIDQLLFSVIGEDDHRDVLGHAIRAQIFQDGKPIHLGKPDVEKHDVRHLILGMVEALFAGLGYGNPVAVELELELVHLGDRRVIFDEEDVNVLIDHVTHVPSLAAVSRNSTSCLSPSPPFLPVVSITKFTQDSEICRQKARVGRAKRKWYDWP